MVVTAPGNAYYANVHLADDADAIMVLAKGVNPQDGRPTELLLQRTDGVTRLVAKGTAVEDVDFDSGITDVRQVEVFFDRNVVEVFLNGGQTAGACCSKALMATVSFASRRPARSMRLMRVH